MYQAVSTASEEIKGEINLGSTTCNWRRSTVTCNKQKQKTTQFYSLNPSKFVERVISIHFCTETYHLLVHMYIHWY